MAIPKKQDGKWFKDCDHTFSEWLKRLEEISDLEVIRDKKRYKDYERAVLKI